MSGPLKPRTLKIRRHPEPRSIPSPSRKRVGILVFPSVEVLDFAGPFEVFSVTRLNEEKRREEASPFEVVLVGEEPGVVIATGGLRVVPNHTLDDCPPLDILLVPGGWGVRAEIENRTLIYWIAERGRDAEIVAGVCTGSMLLGKAGLLDGHSATTHWKSLDWMRQSFPGVTVVDNLHVVEDGEVVTSAGISAGIELALRVVALYHGEEVARSTARQMEYRYPEDNRRRVDRLAEQQSGESRWWGRLLARLSRRRLLALSGLALMSALGHERRAPAQNTLAAPFFHTRGVVITPEDLSLGDWPERARRAGLTTVALHPFPGKVLDFVRTDAGARFLERCRTLGLQVEYELHAMWELLPRDLFARDPAFFRMNDRGDRVPDANLCVHSRAALDVAAEKALTFARQLRPTTGRYFFWGDDGQPWCRCTKCRDLSDSDQALLFANHLLKALRRFDPRATLAHLAYASTLSPPTQIRPEPGVFLEYAPIRRSYDTPYERQTGAGQPDALPALDANLKVFPADTAQVLEYWLDVSRFSGWKRPAVKLPWRRDVLDADLATYAARGIRHVTSFAVYVDDDYRRRHGNPEFIQEYGESLRRPPVRKGN